MSIRFDAAADRLVVTSGMIDHNSAYTTLLFFYLLNDPGAGNVYMIWSANQNLSGINYDQLYVTNSTGIKLGCKADKSGSNTIELASSTISTGTWYCVALVRSSSTDLQIYQAALGAAMASVATNARDVSSRLAATREEIGGYQSTNNNPLGTPGARVFAVKQWQAALTADELTAEAQTIRPQRFANLYRWTSFWEGEHTADYSGNGNNWGSAGTLTDEQNAPVGWGAGLASVLIPVGATYSQDIDGAVTPAGALVRATNKLFVGGLTPAGGLTRQAAKTFVGSLTPSGATLKTTSKATDGAIEPAGALVKQMQKTLAGVVEPAGALVRQATKVLIGGLTPAGSLLRDTAKILAGALTPSGAVDSGRTLFQALAGSLTPAGVVLKQTALSVAGSLTPTGSVSAVRVLFLALVGALTPSGALATEAINTLVRLIEYVNGSFVALVNLAGRILTPALRGEFGRSDVEGEVEND